MDFSKPLDTVSLFTACIKALLLGARLVFIGKTALGVPIPCIRIGRGRRAVLIVGAHHGTEHITANIALKFALDLLHGELPHADGISATRAVFAVPMLNIDGCAIARGDSLPLSPEKYDPSVFPRWQANARGVDLNHNYPAGFSACKEAERAIGITSPSSTRYGGELPLSEPETAALARLTRALAPRLSVAVALHTQGEEIYYDYGGKVPRGAGTLAERMALVSGYRLSRPEENIASHAGYKDWVIEKFGVPAFTVECGRGSNPLPPDDFPEIYKKVRPILTEAALF